MRIQVRVNDIIAETCTIYEGQSVNEVAQQIAQKYCLSEDTKERIRAGIESQFGNI